MPRNFICIWKIPKTFVYLCKEKTMTEDELKQKMDDDFKNLSPIIDKMTHLIMDAYEQGVNFGIELGKEFKK